MDDEEPTWQPISALPMLTAHAAEGARLARQHLDTLREATPYRLDDATVAGLIRTWEVTRDDLDQLFAEQGRGVPGRRATSSTIAPWSLRNAAWSRRFSPSPTGWRR